ncbi:hypothetical protein [Nocardiopsis alborubida]|uniref:Uncharacterized protein n=1 Tax=Nocardiopsis alborubida TaxID=146802 RepID=A0A7X6M8R2_9ACTN|nr:hypothetical protein [Nocardiopsis alborubida]NKY96717.1 hypothetical protein [Nocardiopsis alborubida]
MFTHQPTTPTPNLTRLENPGFRGFRATDPAEQHVHGAYGRRAADDPHLVAVDILGLGPQQVHQVVLRALADHVSKPTSAEHSSLMQ